MNAIEFENVSKQYRLGLVGTGTLAHDVRRWWITNILRQEDPYLKIGETNDRASKGNSDYVWALKDITFNVEQGDVVGIIGKNGAGKSTLLKLLSRVTGPTTGTIRAHGRIGSLLEVGTGFHSEMTGRENIFMNGAILGMRKQEIQAKLDEIIDFSGCERYIDTPVKRYSSGMMVRLGFAVAAHLDPEILVVDEVLAVGDAEFQKKAIGKMQDVSKGEGRTVLFVSHNMASVKQLCNHGVLLEHGMVKYTGEVRDVIEHYLGNDFQQNCNKYFDDEYVGNEHIQMKSVEMECDDPTGLTFAEDIRIKYRFINKTKDKSLDMSFCVFNMMDVKVIDDNAFVVSKEDAREGEYEVVITIPKNFLNKGRYYICNWFLGNKSDMLWAAYNHNFEIFNAHDRGEVDGLLLVHMDSAARFVG